MLGLSGSGEEEFTENDDLELDEVTSFLSSNNWKTLYTPKLFGQFLMLLQESLDEVVFLA